MGWWYSNGTRDISWETRDKNHGIKWNIMGIWWDKATNTVGIFLGSWNDDRLVVSHDWDADPIWLFFWGSVENTNQICCDNSDMKSSGGKCIAPGYYERWYIQYVCIYIYKYLYIFIDIKNWDVAKDGTANTAIDDGWLLIDTYCFTLVKSEWWCFHGMVSTFIWCCGGAYSSVTETVQCSTITGFEGCHWAICATEIIGLDGAGWARF
jgi:hypothetical protein